MGAVARQVVAAGGLGTRAAYWAQDIPKEFYPVGGRPGIVHLLEEIAALGPDAVVVPAGQQGALILRSTSC